MAYTDIDKSEDYFNTVLYTGDGSASRDITGVGFQPDFTWIKQRSGVLSHVLGNSVSGDNKFLSTNGTSAESTDSTKFRTFVSDGFQVGSHPGVNGNTETYVGWSWLADNTSGSSNTDGSITSTVSANTTSGFSIVSYTGNGTSGATVGHGLGVAPAMIFVKNRSSANDWNGFHKSLTGTNGIFLNLTSATSPSSTFWNNTNPTSSVFTIGNHVTVNTNTNNYIAYCFAEKKGFSKIGSYTGNGSADGTFIYTGFKPSFLLTKRTDSTSSWQMYDNKRLGYNVDNDQMRADTSDAEDTSDDLDILSSGFKMRNTGAAYNASGGSYIYMAFAENPFVTSTGIPTTAR